MPTFASLCKFVLGVTFCSGLIQTSTAQRFVRQDVEAYRQISCPGRQDQGPQSPLNYDEALASDDLAIFAHPAFPQYGIRYKSTSLCDPNVKQISGYLDISTDKHLFFWFFESRNKPKEDPLVLWLNGGPGCSSLTGLMMELGPCTVNKDGNGTDINKYSWTNKANMIFLDQPINTGYSYGEGHVISSDQAANDVYAFLQLFFKKYPEYSKLDFHVAGESYAGHYIPAIGEVLYKRNKGIYPATNLRLYASTLTSINLKSLMIGNGLTDPLLQNKYYGQMACKNSYEPVLDESSCEMMDLFYNATSSYIEDCYKLKDNCHCQLAEVVAKDQLRWYSSDSGRSVYDVRKKCAKEDQCYPLIPMMKKFLNRKDIKKSLGVDQNIEYDSCNSDISVSFKTTGDWMRPSMDKLSPLLDNGIRVLIYAGDADYICNWMGNKAWTKALRWSASNKFVTAKDVEWISPTTNKKIGELRMTPDDRFAFLRVYEAGHFVPYDQPEHALDMFNAWIKKQVMPSA
ncbi:hypothetical protein EC973_006502 [Apophysomyces ossiformis]|uniref:Carboxypeptidase n=1 Tax=Apophysomyces ossiformis TaxID=679940 RepID=A0A8H7BW94_9FUNG|nr:hypothetical protein EC973_006502 [Apophysomyces ossiformis]